MTTGDDSGTAEDLERKLRELKNRCRYNRTGLLPQAEAELADLDRKLNELEQLELQSRKLRQRCSELESTLSDLENHRASLLYRVASENAQRRRQADAALAEANARFQHLEAQCADLSDESLARQTRAALLDLQQQWAQIRLETQLLKPLPAHPLFPDMTPAEALEKATADAEHYQKLLDLPIWWLILPLLAVFAGIAALFLAPEHPFYGYCTIGVGILGMVIWAIAAALRRSRATAIAKNYGNTDTTSWIRVAEDYVNLSDHNSHAETSCRAAIATLRQQTEALCKGQSLAQALFRWQEICQHWDALQDARKDLELAREHCRILEALPVDAPAPEHPDRLTLTESQTRNAQVDTAGELRELQRRLGQCQGQMEAIGHRTVLEQRQDQAAQRVRRLEDTYGALELALSTLEQARNALQRRFAPRITSRAQEILHRLTEGRYDRLVLGEDLTLQANSRDEETLRTALWRSDGTSDLLYLTLRLAVAGELTPEAPLILDDALVRFDDRRLAQAMEVLKEEASDRQIILFTCHSRETQYTQKKEP